MAVFNGNNVKVAVGTLYAAPIGTAEPSSITGAWPNGWVSLGYTDTGSEFDSTPTTADVIVEEEYFPIRIATVNLKGSLTFALAETTRQNLAIALNAGVGSTLVAASQGTQTGSTDGTGFQDVPLPGTEVRVMLGWDALPEGASTGADPFGRLIARQCLQSGSVKRIARKGNNKALWACTFSFEKPPGATTAPFRWLFNPGFFS